MRHFRAVLQVSVVFVAAVCRSQTGGRPSEKIVFVRPDPMITTSSSMAMLSADTHGSASGNGDQPKGAVAINSVENPGMQFHSASDAKMNLLAFMNPDGSGITDLHVNGFDPSVSPDGTKIAFCSLRDDQYSQIYVVNADGTGQQRLTKITSGDACGPVWSHDGKKIAFYAFSLPNPSRNPAIWVMDPDGKNVKRLTEHAVSPTWSPDDRQIAFASDRAGKFQIFAMNYDGSNVRRLTEDKGEDSSPRLGPRWRIHPVRFRPGRRASSIVPDGRRRLPTTPPRILQTAGFLLPGLVAGWQTDCFFGFKSSGHSIHHCRRRASALRNMDRRIPVVHL